MGRDRPGAPLPLPLLLAALVLLGGCGVAGPSSGRGLVLSDAQGGSGEVLEMEPSADLFQQVQEASGLGEDSRHPAGAMLSGYQARELLSVLARTPVTQRTSPRAGPCVAAARGARRRRAGGVRRAAVASRRFMPLVWVRPDGYLVDAFTGRPCSAWGRCTGEGEWWVGHLCVGDFYFSRGGVFYPVNEALRLAGGPPLAELGVGHPLNAAMDGVRTPWGR